MVIKKILRPLKGIRARLLWAFGSMLTILFWVITLIVLNQWRQMVLSDAESQVESVTRAFSVFVIETFILAEDNQIQVDDALEYYFRDYLDKEPRLRYISIYDERGIILVHSDPQRFILGRRDSLAGRIVASGNPVNMAFEDTKYGWLMESAFPLRIAGKSWGVLHMAFEADSVRRELRQLFIYFVSSAILITIIALAILYLLSGYVTASLRNLVSSIDHFEIDTPIHLDNPIFDDEISTLYEHFIGMQNRLKDSQHEIMDIQKQIYHAEKLASIGRLASGIAHEINNPLNGIRNCIYRLDKHKLDQKNRDTYLQLINEGVLQIESIVKKLLGFARKERQVFEAVDIHKSLQTVISLLEYKLTQNRINIKLDFDPELPLLKGDPQLLQEVFMNVLLNSFDAMEKEGEIVVRTKKRRMGKIRICIEDNGSGIDEKSITQIFDPFFTTKDPGKGTGLGLSVAQNIVEAHGGSIEIVSTPKVGTKVEIILNTGDRIENSPS